MPGTRPDRLGVKGWLVFRGVYDGLTLRKVCFYVILEGLTLHVSHGLLLLFGGDVEPVLVELELFCPRQDAASPLLSLQSA